MDEATALAFQRAACEQLEKRFGSARRKRRNRRRWSRNRLLAAARGAAELLGSPLGVHPFLQHVGTTTSTLYRFFPAGWHDLLREAGLEPLPPGTTRQWTDDELLAEYDRVHESLGRHPTLAELGRLATPSRSTFLNRLGGKAEIEDRHGQWSGAAAALSAADSD